MFTKCVLLLAFKQKKSIYQNVKIIIITPDIKKKKMSINHAYL